MIGKPIFGLGENVWFTLQGQRYEGFVYNIDEYGTFERDDDVSYDIMCDDMRIGLIKHVSEHLLKKSSH